MDIEVISSKKPRSKKLMLEKHSDRGLVPTQAFGRLDKEYNAYLDTLDPRGDKGGAVRLALASSSDIRFREFLDRASAPANSRMTLATIAKSCDISLPQFAEFWQKSQHMRALAMAQDGVTELTGDMIEDARTQRVSCDRCDGAGEVFSEPGRPGNRLLDPTKPDGEQVRDCPACDATGKVRKIGDVDSRKMLLEMTGHTGKRGGGVQIVQNFGGAGMESAVSKLGVLSFDVTAEEVEE